MDDLKTWAVEVGIKKLLPMAVMGAITSLGALMATHHGLLSSMGIDYDATQRTIDISLDTLSNWMIVVLGGLITAGMAAAKHHTVAAIEGTPQSGDKRADPPLVVVGGKRADDPKLN